VDRPAVLDFDLAAVLATFPSPLWSVATQYRHVADLHSSGGGARGIQCPARQVLRLDYLTQRRDAPIDLGQCAAGVMR
jgi:hypothetical protein